MRSRRTVVLLIGALALWSGEGAPEVPGWGEPSDWWNPPLAEPFDAQRLSAEPDFIRVDGNRFVDERGASRVFMGVAISDPDKLERGGRWEKSHLEAAKRWGADVVRIPVHPVAWRGRGKVGYLELLDQAVVWANELGFYLMIDWHTIGNLQTGLFQHPMYDTTIQETLEFWRTIAARYRGVSTIAFYELFNEPTTFRGQLGTASWTEWKRLNEEMIGIIFAHDDTVIPLVAGFDWAYDLRPVAEAPIEAGGIGYVSHPTRRRSSPPGRRSGNGTSASSPIATRCSSPSSALPRPASPAPRCRWWATRSAAAGSSTTWPPKASPGPPGASIQSGGRA